jgi:hypothetical protein
LERKRGGGGEEAGGKKSEGGREGAKGGGNAGRDLAAFRTTIIPPASWLPGADVSILNLHIAQVCMHELHESPGLHRVWIRVQGLLFMTSHQGSTGRVSLTRLPILGLRVAKIAIWCRG